MNGYVTLSQILNAQAPIIAVHNILLLSSFIFAIKSTYELSSSIPKFTKIDLLVKPGKQQYFKR
jgi:hypothetical protein